MYSVVIYKSSAKTLSLYYIDLIQLLFLNVIFGWFVETTGASQRNYYVLISIVEHNVTT